MSPMSALTIKDVDQGVERQHPGSQRDEGGDRRKYLRVLDYKEGSAGVDLMYENLGTDAEKEAQINDKNNTSHISQTDPSFKSLSVTCSATHN